MRAINLSNDKSRNAQVGFEQKREKSDIRTVLRGGGEYTNARFLKSTLATELPALVDLAGSTENFATNLITSDPEIDFERVGMYLSGVRKIFIADDNSISYRVNREEVVFTPEGEEKDVHPFEDVESNINTDIPLRWTGKLIPIEKAARMFVFSRKYQIKHINGLTYDFLYDMAKQLADKRSVMLLGAGPKGVGPIVINRGGTPYRAFLEGRIEGEKYCLIIHLTNLELKTL